jgi:hypothetical protein
MTANPLSMYSEKNLMKRNLFMTNGHEFDKPIAYQIRLKGALDSSWSEWFGGFTITLQGDETILIGIVRDQSALHGILAKINDLGLSIVSLERISLTKNGGMVHG